VIDFVKERRSPEEGKRTRTKGKGGGRGKRKIIKRRKKIQTKRIRMNNTD